MAAKNGIMDVEVAEQKLQQGLIITEAAVQSAESRLQPILMTAIAAQAGFLPQWWPPTVLSLGVVPPVCVLVKNLENRLFTRQDALAQQAIA